MILRRAEGLDVPLRERNDLLLVAGYAPVSPEPARAAPRMARVRAAMRQVLDAHAPYPAAIAQCRIQLLPTEEKGGYQRHSRTPTPSAPSRASSVTVRTLRNYDETGLLKPLRRTVSQFRWYQRSDLLRLQQLLTLKALGFTLADVRSLLEGPASAVQESLHIQKEAIDRRIAALGRASRALGDALDRLNAASDPDWIHLITIIHVVSADDAHEWRRRYGADL